MLVETSYHHTLAWFRAFRAHDVTPPQWRWTAFVETR